jgi:hypothetical protein
MRPPQRPPGCGRSIEVALLLDHPAPLPAPERGAPPTGGAPGEQAVAVAGRARSALSRRGLAVPVRCAGDARELDGHFGRPRGNLGGARCRPAAADAQRDQRGEARARATSARGEGDAREVSVHVERTVAASKYPRASSPLTASNRPRDATMIPLRTRGDRRTDHDVDLRDHDADRADHDGPIRVITMRRSR